MTQKEQEAKIQQLLQDKIYYMKKLIDNNNQLIFICLTMIGELRYVIKTNTDNILSDAILLNEMQDAIERYTRKYRLAQKEVEHWTIELYKIS